MKTIKIKLGVVLVTFVCLFTVAASEWFDWCGSTTTINNATCTAHPVSGTGVYGFQCDVVGAICQITVTTYACSAAAWTCDPSSCAAQGPIYTPTGGCGNHADQNLNYVYYSCQCNASN